MTVTRVLLALLLGAAGLAAQTGGVRYVHRRAERLLEERNFVQGIAYLERSAKQFPKDGPIRIYAGECFYSLERYAEAVEHFAAGLELAPALAPRVVRYPKALFELGRLEDAARAYRTIVDEGSSDRAQAQGRFGLGLVAIHQGDLATARRELELARKLWPGSKKVLFRLGQTLRRQGEAEAALTCFERVCELDGLHVAAVQAVAQTLVQLGRREESRPWRDRYFAAKKAAGEVREIELALRQRPGDVTLLGRLGALYFDHRRYGDAIGAYRALTARSPGNPEPRYRLGQAYYRAGELKKARQQLTQVVRAAPDHAAAQQLLETILATVSPR